MALRSATIWKLIKIEEILTFEIWQARDEQFQLFIGEYGDKISWNYFIKSVKEGIDLLLDALVQMVVGLSLNVVLLVLVCQVNISTSWDEVDLLSPSKIVFTGAECFTEYCDIAWGL